jgi:hypothetical protein
VSLNTYLVTAVAAKVGAEDYHGYLTDTLAQRLVQSAFSVLSGLTEWTARDIQFRQFNPEETGAALDRRLPTRR